MVALALRFLSVASSLPVITSFNSNLLSTICGQQAFYEASSVITKLNSNSIRRQQFLYMASTSTANRDMGPQQKWKVCTVCHGEGKRMRGPTKKARLRHKRTKLDSPAPSRVEGCKKCNQTGLLPCDDDSDSSVESPTRFSRGVAIIGGGLGGFALGIALMHRNIPFQIFERDTAFNIRKQGYGLTMQQASRALSAFGISSLKDGITSTRHVVHTTDGNQVGEWGLRKWGRDENKRPPKRQNVHIARQALRGELLKALGDEGKISWGHKLVGINEKKDSTIELEFVLDNGDTIHQTADLVVGADGIRSTVRKHLVGSDLTPLRYLGCIVVLGICALDRLSIETQECELLDGHTVFQTADGNTRIYLMPFSETEYMWQLSFPMKDEGEAKELSRRGSNALKDIALAKCSEWHVPIPDILQNTPLELVSGYPVYDRDLITQDMLSNDSAITLLGDAAHPMSPFKGQGANQALLDALSLARCLYTDASKDDVDIVESIKKYHDEMIDRSTKKVQASANAAHFLHTELAIKKGNMTRGAVATVDE